MEKMTMSGYQVRDLKCSHLYEKYFNREMVCQFGLEFFLNSLPLRA